MKDYTQDPGAFRGVVDRIRAIRRELPPAAARIADFITANAEAIVHMSVTEVAEGANASEGSVVGFCQLLGSRGFQQVKMTLVRDLVEPVQFIHEDVLQDDKPAVVVEKVFRADIQALHDTQKALNVRALEAAIGAIRRAKRVEVFGIGSSAPVAEDASYRLLRIGLNARASVDSHSQAVVATLADQDVTTLTISHSGSTSETLEATRLAKRAGATTIGITNFGKSPLLAHCDIVLNTLARETHFRMEATSSRVVQLAIIDALVTCLSLADYDRSMNAIDKTAQVLALKRV